MASGLIIPGRLFIRRPLYICQRNWLEIPIAMGYGWALSWPNSFLRNTPYVTDSGGTLRSNAMQPRFVGKKSSLVSVSIMYRDKIMEYIVPL